jgi:hypothetical protein
MTGWFVSSGEEITPRTTIAQLHRVHAMLANHFRLASASYLLLCLQSSGAHFALWTGDCLLGRSGTQGGIDWLTQPHTLANPLAALPVAEIASMKTRHVLTRSFRAKRFIDPIVATPSHPCWRDSRRRIQEMATAQRADGLQCH